MPKITIDLSQAAINKLNVKVQRTNENAGTNLTLKQWLQLHAQELAIEQELATAVQAIQEQQQRDAQTALEDAVRTARDELLAEL